MEEGKPDFLSFKKAPASSYWMYFIFSGLTEETEKKFLFLQYEFLFKE